jgi:hypothetical protein
MLTNVGREFALDDSRWSFMSGFFHLLRVLCGAGVILLLQAGVAWAEETTARGVSSTIYAGGGTLVVPNNETYPDLYDVQRLGVAGHGVWRFDAPRASARHQEHGFFGAFGAGFELEASKLRPCHGNDNGCFAGSTPVGERYWGKHVAARLGFGYSWRLFEFRLGALAALPDARVDYANPVVLPDVLLRAGNRNLAWVELGLGAYDASTNLRPGIYLGGAVGSEQVVRVSGHVGIHLVNGLCCNTVTSVGYRYELGATRALTDALSVGVGAALLSAQNDYDHDNAFAGEGRAQLTLAL